jgi:hypothetical protein
MQNLENEAKFAKLSEEKDKTIALLKEQIF